MQTHNMTCVTDTLSNAALRVARELLEICSLMLVVHTAREALPRCGVSPRHPDKSCPLNVNACYSCNLLIATTTQHICISP